MNYSKMTKKQLIEQLKIAIDNSKKGAARFKRGTTVYFSILCPTTRECYPITKGVITSDGTYATPFGDGPYRVKFNRSKDKTDICEIYAKEGVFLTEQEAKEYFAAKAADVNYGPQVEVILDAIYSDTFTQEDIDMLLSNSVLKERVVTELFSSRLSPEEFLSEIRRFNADFDKEVISMSSLNDSIFYVKRVTTFLTQLSVKMRYAELLSVDYPVDKAAVENIRAEVQKRFQLITDKFLTIK